MRCVRCGHGDLHQDEVGGRDSGAAEGEAPHPPQAPAPAPADVDEDGELGEEDCQHRGQHHPLHNQHMSASTAELIEIEVAISGVGWARCCRIFSNFF